MTPSDMTVWDRLAMLFPTCTADEIEKLLGDHDEVAYSVTLNRLKIPSGEYVKESGLRAAIDAMKPKPWHEVAQEALKDTWLQDYDCSLINDCQIIEYIDREDRSSAFRIYEKGLMFNWTGGEPEGFIDEHNQIAGLLRAAGLTQFKCYKLVEDTEQ